MNDTSETTPTSVRRAQPGDLDEILDMVRQATVFHGADPTLTFEQLRGNLFGNPPWLLGLVAEKNLKLVGYATLSPRVVLQTGTRGFHLEHLFVRSEFRGKGVGRALLEATEMAAMRNGCSYITVGVAERNVPAQEFYLNLGYLRAQRYGRDFRKVLPPRRRPA